MHCGGEQRTGPKYPENHPQEGEEILREKGVSEEMIRAILSHANYTGVSRESLMEKILYAVDELSGFVVAVAYVRPGKLEGMKVKSVKKKLKDKISDIDGIEFRKLNDREECGTLLTILFKSKDKAVEFEQYLKSGSGRAFAKKRFL